MEELYCRRAFSASGSKLAFDQRFAAPGMKPQYAPDRNFKILHVKLELDLQISKRTLLGTATTTVRPYNPDAGEIIFEAAEMKIISVHSKKKKLSFKHEKEKLAISIPSALAKKEFDISIKYKVVKPKLGLFFILPDKHYPKKPMQVWTQGEDIYNKYWFPCHNSPDEKATSETIISVPKGFTAVSNGELVKKWERGGKSFSHWRMGTPHSSYLTSIAVGKFSEVRDNWKGIPVLYYCEPGREKEIRNAFGKTPKMLEFFSQKIGVNYPYKKYSQVAAADFIYGGMENISATTQTDVALHDERAIGEATSSELAAHELAHQWFGDLLTCRFWQHAWLNESFATYFEALFKEHDAGEEEFKYELYQNAKIYFDEFEKNYSRPIATNFFNRGSDLFDRHLYEKGSLVLHMIRSILGDKMWWKAINNYVKKNAGRSVETEDLILAIEEVTGKNFRKFFDQWIFKAGHPEYKVLYSWDSKKKEAVVRVAQTQKASEETSLFSLSIDFEFFGVFGKKLFTKTVEKKEEEFRFKLSGEPKLFSFDPKNNILKKAEILKPREMWIYQFTKSKSLMERIFACHAIAKFGSDADAKLLGKYLLKEKSWCAQIEIASALGTIRTDAAFSELVSGLKLKNKRARRAVVRGLGEFQNKKVFEILKPLLWDKTSYLVPLEAARSIGKTRDPKVLPELKKLFRFDSWKDSLRTGAVLGIANLQTPEAVKILIERTKYGHHNWSRMYAALALGEIGKGNEKAFQCLLKLVDDPFILLQVNAIESLGEIGDERAVPAFEKILKQTREGRVLRAAEEAMRKIYSWREVSEFEKKDDEKKK